MRPLVSICLPTLNARRFLLERMESILAQSIADWEVVACDSRSSDGTWEFLESFKKDSRIRIFQVPREGLYAGWNECLRRVRGEYIHFATADDTCEATFLEKMVGLIATNPSADLGYCAHRRIDVEGNPVPRITQTRVSEFFGGLWQQNHLSKREFNTVVSAHFTPIWTTMSAVVFRSSLLNKIGRFRRDFRHCGDSFWSLCAAVNTDFVYHAEEMATWRCHDKQATFSVPDIDTQFQLYRCRLEFMASHRAELLSLWAEHTDIEEILFGHFRAYIKEKIDFNRRRLISDPLGFCKSFRWLMKNWPSYVLSRLRCGLVYDSKAISPVVKSCNRALETLRPELPSPL